MTDTYVSCPQTFLRIGRINFLVMVKGGMDFRAILKHKDKCSPVLFCLSHSSPECQLKFVAYRVEQTMCLKCLVYNNLLDAHPIIPQEE